MEVVQFTRADLLFPIVQSNFRLESYFRQPKLSKFSLNSPSRTSLMFNNRENSVLLVSPLLVSP